MDKGLFDAITQPIPGSSSPSGAPPDEGEEIYDRWYEELIKMPYPVPREDNGKLKWGSINWRNLADYSFYLLTKRAKNLDYMNSLALAIFQLNRYDGLASLIQSYSKLLKNFWDSLYPTELSDREEAIRQLNESLSMAISEDADKEPLESEAPAVLMCKEAIEGLRDVIRKKFDPPPSIGSLVEAIIARAKTVEEFQASDDKGEMEISQATEIPTEASVAAIAVSSTGNYAAVYNNALELLRSGKREQAYHLLADRIISAGVERLDRIWSQLHLAKLCLLDNRFRIAGVLFELLKKDNTDYKLGELVPKLSAEINQSLSEYQGRINGETRQIDSTVTTILSLLCNFNIRIALKVDDELGRGS